MSGVKTYAAHGISLVYPENWILEESEMDGAAGSLQLTNDGGAFWLLKKYPFGTNPEDLAREAVSAMRSEYKDMEVDRFDAIESGKNTLGFDMTFFYLDLMNLAKVLCFEQDGLTYAVFWQTGNQLIIQSDEVVPIDKVLEAITLSLLRGEA